MNTWKDRRVSEALSDHEIEQYMTSFRVGLARMDADPDEASRIDALIATTDFQERTTQPAEDVRAVALSLAGIAEALQRGSLQKESAMTAIAEVLQRGSLQKDSAMTAGVSTIASADTLETIAVTDTGGLVLPSYERPAGLHPPLDFDGYRSTALRHPRQPLVLLPHRLTEVTGPLLGDSLITPTDSDLTTQHDGEPQGQRIILTGRVLDSDGRPVPDTLIEIWQANAAGRYRHSREHHPAPLDPNFDGIGRAITDSDGRYRFVTIQPGAYPWGNHYNAWRPAQIHFSLFGRAFTQRLVTQMYFPGDPLLPLDPIFNSVPDEKARQRLIADFDIELTQPEWALGYHWDIVLRGRDATVSGQAERAERHGRELTPSQTVGPYFAMRLPWDDGPFVVPEGTPGAITIVGRLYDGAGNIIPDGLIETWQAGPDGRFAHPDDPRGASPRGYHGFRGFGRCPTAPDGSFRIVTLKPGPLPTPDGGLEAPHLDVSVFARGLLDRVVTRMYFPDERIANAADPVLRSIGEPPRRATLIAVPEPEGELRFDIHLQGDRETVFFDV